jgi:hypothetical protein
VQEKHLIGKFVAKLTEYLLSRRRIVAVCRAGALLSLLVLSVLFIMESSSFLMKLAACFVFFLFAFHWFFGAAKWLTVTHARLIDYVYLTIAATGVFIFALNYEDKREEYIDAVQAAAAHVSRREQHKAFVQSVTELESASCEPTVVTLMSSYCEQAKVLKDAAVKEFDRRRWKLRFRDFWKQRRRRI